MTAKGQAASAGPDFQKKGIRNELSIRPARAVRFGARARPAAPEDLEGGKGGIALPRRTSYRLNGVGSSR